MKIVHIIFSFNNGGAELMLIDIVNEQVKDNAVSLIIMDKGYESSLISKCDERLSIYFVERTPGSKNVLKLFYLNRLLIIISPDIIHCHDHNLILGILPFFKNKCLTVHDVGYRVDILSRYDRIFAISEAVKRDIESRSSISASLVENGICVSKIKCKKPQIEKNVYSILTVGRLRHEKKGQDILIKAVADVKVLRPDICLKIDIIGEGPSFDFLTSLIRDLNVDKEVRLLGNQSRETVYENICEYNLFVLPSRYEGFGLVVAEAMAANVLVLVCDNHGPIEIIKGGELGYSFLSGNHENLTEKIIKAYDNRQSHSSMLAEARAHVLSKYNVTQMVEKYLQSYEEMFEK